MNCCTDTNAATNTKPANTKPPASTPAGSTFGYVEIRTPANAETNTFAANTKDRPADAPPAVQICKVCLVFWVVVAALLYHYFLKD